MNKTIIAARGRNGAIGLNNAVPWKCSQDMQLFRQTTTHHTVLMGRATYESIGRPLPNRRNIVVSSTEIDGVQTVQSISRGIQLAEQEGEKELYFIGGRRIYLEALNHYATHMLLTEVDYDGPADTLFPQFDDVTWEETWRSATVHKEGSLPCVFRVLRRRNLYTVPPAFPP